MVKTALEYARRGWLILACKPRDKVPATAHGVHDATVDEAIIEAWWRRWPEANIGIATGAASGIVVLDIDGEAGEASLLRLLAGQPEPETVQALTGGGGRHFLFLHPGGVVKNAVRLGGFEGIDLRGDGGYVVAPPSVHTSGRVYAWDLDHHLEETEIAPIPDWLSKLIMKKEHTEAPTPEGEPIADGTRNSRLASMAGALRRYGASVETIYTALTMENSRCTPPLEEDELQTIAGSIAKYPPAPDTYHHTDLGNAERLAALFGDRIRYCYDWQKWLIWNGVIWRPDSDGEILKLAAETVRNMYAAAARCEDPDDRSKLAKHAAASESLWRQKAMIELAQPMVSTLIRHLDPDPMLLGVRNGTVDLRTGELREGDPSQMITKQADVIFDPTAQCDTFELFLDQIFAGDNSLKWYVQKAVGYSLTGDVREQCVFVCHGRGANGKSTLLSAIMRTLGDYAIATPAAAILAKRNESIPNDIARLRGIRYTTVLEIEQGRKIDEPLIKGLTGQDTIPARFLFSEYFDLVPQFKLFLGTNHKPAIAGRDHGIWRRIRMIPFLVQIPEEMQDKELPQKLDAERPGILRWLIDGCLAWQREGLESPAAVIAATEEYRSEQDILADFISDALEEERGWWLQSSDLFRAYTKWCETAGEKPRSQRWLTMQMEERGYLRRRTNAGKGWDGIALVREHAS